jgi:hypothetical protein
VSEGKVGERVDSVPLPQVSSLPSTPGGQSVGPVGSLHLYLDVRLTNWGKKFVLLY